MKTYRANFNDELIGPERATFAEAVDDMRSAFPLVGSVPMIARHGAVRRFRDGQPDGKWYDEDISKSLLRQFADEDRQKEQSHEAP